MYRYDCSNRLGAKLEVGCGLSALQHRHRLALGMGWLPHNTIIYVGYGLAEYCSGRYCRCRCRGHHTQDMETLHMSQRLGVYGLHQGV